MIAPFTPDAEQLKTIELPESTKKAHWFHAEDIAKVLIEVDDEYEGLIEELSHHNKINFWRYSLVQNSKFYVWFK